MHCLKTFLPITSHRRWDVCVCGLGFGGGSDPVTPPQHEHLLETPNPLFVSSSPPSQWITMTTPIHIMAECWLYSFTQLSLNRIYCFRGARFLFFEIRCRGCVNSSQDVFNIRGVTPSGENGSSFVMHHCPTTSKISSCLTDSHVSTPQGICAYFCSSQ